MKMLVVAATESEIGLFRKHLEGRELLNGCVDILITGVGPVQTAYAVTRKLGTEKYDLVLQAGVGGSFNRDIQLGELVSVTSDRYGDTGAEDHDSFLDIFDMGLIDANAAPYEGGWLQVPPHQWSDFLPERRAIGITVSSVSGTAATIARREALYHADVESMEGVALHYVCLQEQVTFAQVRAISNYVIPRDKSQWRMKEAIINLNNWLIGFCKQVVVAEEMK